MSTLNQRFEVLVGFLLSVSPLVDLTRGPHHPKGPLAKHGEHHHHYVPQRESPGHYDSQTSQILTHDKNLLHDKEHIREDLGDWIFENEKNLTPEEMEFHYFKMHDFDSNSKLDGLEILQALSHILPTVNVAAEVNEDPLQQGKYFSRDAPLHKQREDDFNYYVGLIDKVLEEDDVDNDGYLSYAEYVLGRLREEDGKLKIATRHK